MAKVAARAFETTWLNEFFRLYGGEVNYRRSDLRSWSVSLLDILEIGRSGTVIDGDKSDGPGAWWTIAGVTANAVFLHVSVVVITDHYYVEILDVRKVSGENEGSGNAA